MVTRRDGSAITKKTRYRWSPASVSTSTVNRSQAVRPSQCACRNVFPGMRRLRSGAGSIPWSCRIRFTVVRAISWPRFESAPRIRVYPHWGFSTAIWTTSAAPSRRVIGRPRPRRALPSYVWAINLRYQRRIVSGVTMPATCITTRRPSFWPRTASRRRWASVRRSGRGPRCSRRTRFSSRRYAIRSSWWRVTQPANVRTRTCSAGIVKLTKSSSIDPQDTGLEPAVNPPCWASRMAVGLNLTVSIIPLPAEVAR